MTQEPEPTSQPQYYPTLQPPASQPSTAATTSPKVTWAIAIAATLAAGILGATTSFIGLVLFLPMLPVGVGFGIYFLLTRSRLRKRVGADLYSSAVKVPRYERAEKYQTFLQAFMVTLQAALLLCLLSILPWLLDLELGTRLLGDGNSDDQFFSMLPTAGAILLLSLTTIVTSILYFRSIPLAAGEQYALLTRGASAKFIAGTRVLNTVVIIAYLAITLPLLVILGGTLLGLWGP